MSFWDRLFKKPETNTITKGVAIAFLQEALDIHKYWMKHPEFYAGTKFTIENDRKWIERYTAIISYIKEYGL